MLAWPLIMQECEGARSTRKSQDGHAARFEGVLLGCSVTMVTPSKARDGKARLNIRSLGGRTSDSEHFVMIWLPGWKQE